jgi:Sulfotransferase family
MARHERWMLLPPARVAAALRWRTRAVGGPAAPELIVTGISRSGTSYLCRLLHRFDNCVAVNEPREIVSRLRREKAPWGVCAFYRQTRRGILRGTPIENRLLDGEVVEDTAVHRSRQSYSPTVAGDDFVLAVKNTREFLFRLEAVRQVMPAARVVACVRNPFDTIASWKRSFPHLRDADVTPFVHHPKQMWLPAPQRTALERVAATPEAAERRARWWSFLAQRLLDNRDAVLLVDYDDLVRRPMTVLDRVLSGYRPGRLRQPITPSIARPSLQLLDDDDRRAIRAICTRPAAELGLQTARRL